MLSDLSPPVQLGLLVVLITVALLAVAQIIRKRLLARHDRLTQADSESTTTAPSGDNDQTADDPQSRRAEQESDAQHADGSAGDVGQSQSPAEESAAEDPPQPEPATADPGTPQAAANTDQPEPTSTAHTHPAQPHAPRSHLFTILQDEAEDLNNVPTLQADASPAADTSDYVLGSLTPTLAAMLPQTESRSKSLRSELLTAGYYTPHAHINLAAIRYLCIIIPLFFCGFLLVIAPEPAEWGILLALVLLPAVGWATPRIIVQNRGQQRKTEIEKAMPDMLDMLNMCVSQGLTMSDSLGRIGTELQPVYPALSQELRITSEQAKIGTLEQALLNLNDRVQLPEMQSFTSLLIQTERMGTSMVDSLTDYSDGMRTSLQQRADERGNKAAFKLLFPTVLCLMPAVYLFLLGPSIVAMSDFFTGGDNASIRETLQNVERLGRARAQ